ncbi:MAG: hypothetical protein RIQ79_1065 [Verrucomicrobiota bacterium]
MKTSCLHHRSEKCAAHLNKALCIGAFVAFLGLASGGALTAFPASFGIAPGNAQATGLALSLSALVVGAVFLAVGVAQKVSGKSPAACTASAQGSDFPQN